MKSYTKRRSWTIEKLRIAVQSSTSFRQVIGKLGLREAGGNYEQLKKYVKENALDTSHFKGMAWNKGMTGLLHPIHSLEEILTEDNSYQSFKLKKRLFEAKLKKRQCEECGWAKISPDGRLPLELDHINGNRRDNRLENLRILCPNCHSLQPTHRGLNMAKRRHA